MERRHSKSHENSVSEDAMDMKAMSVESSAHENDVESASARACTPVSCFSFSYLTKSSFADFISYVGLRGVAVIVVLKVVTVIAFAYFLMGSSPSGRDGDFSGVTLVGGRPENLRELVHEATKRALKSTAASKALFTMSTQNDLVYDNYIEFVLSYPSTLSVEENQDNNSNNGETWLDEKDKVSTISGLSTPKEIAATRALDRDNDRDPLSLDVVDEQLIVHRFAGSPDPQTVSAAVPEAAGGPVLRVFVPVEQQFTILLNKFNTVKDHCLIVTDSFAPQIAPFVGYELELWHWVLLQTRGVGFYNSNMLAGASQAHRHMQFIPGDEIWTLRNPDATHALPIDDIIMPRIESGRWRAFPYSTTRTSAAAAATVSTGSDSKSTSTSKSKSAVYDKPESFQKRYDAAFMHQLPQFDFQHAVAVLQDRSSFLQYSTGRSGALRAYSDYLQQVYEALLVVNDVNIDTLRACASAETNSGAEHNEQGHPAVDCMHAAGYNLILRPQYMMLVPRGQKNFASMVNVNSFGYLGMFLATKEVARDLIKDVGPLAILKAVSREKTTVLKD